MYKIIYKRQIFDSLNNKKYYELSDNFKKFVKYMYPRIRENDLILCQNKNGSKIDFTISVNNIYKNVSVKKGDTIFVYKDRILNFVLFLLSINVSKECILALLSYHYADGTYDGSGPFVNSFGQLLSIDYEKQIEIVEEEFKNKKLLAKVIDFILLCEKSGKKVDYFYFGDCRKGCFASADIVKNNILNEENNYKHKFMRIGVMNFLPLKREIVRFDKSDYLKHFCVLKLNFKRYMKKSGMLP